MDELDTPSEYNEFLVLLDIDEILKELGGPLNKETIRRYFRKGVFFSHARKNGVGIQSYRGSVLVRKRSMDRLRQGPKRLLLDQMGKAFNEISGPEDNFIVDQLRQGADINKVEDLFVGEARSRLAR